MALLRDKNRRNEIRRSLYEKLEVQGEAIPETIKTLRKILAMDQARFAKHAGISLATLRKIEQQTGNVTLETLEKILDKFSLEIVVKVKKKPSSPLG